MSYRRTLHSPTKRSPSGCERQPRPARFNDNGGSVSDGDGGTVAAVLKELSVVSRAVRLREHAPERMSQHVLIQMRIAQPSVHLPIAPIADVRFACETLGG